MVRHVFDLAHVTKSRPGTENYRLKITRLQILPRDTIAIVGTSGCGKSTALDLLACALKPDPVPAEAVRENGREERPVFRFSPTPDREVDIYAAWARGGSNALASDRMRYLGYVLQTGGLLPFLTARDNILLTCRVLNIVPANIRRIRDITQELNIYSLLGKYPAQLSVGERQRVAIARALAHNPSVILADEPTAALDPSHSKTVMQLFLKLARDQETTVIMVSHDQALAAELGFTLVPMTVTSRRDGVTANLFFSSSMGG